MELGLVTSNAHLGSEESTLLRVLHQCEADIRQLRVGLHVVGRAYSAIVGQGLLSNYEGLHRYSHDRYGGLVAMAAAIAGCETDSLDGVVYLVPPEDMSTLLPEAIALRRQCLVHAKPYLSTSASFIDWIETERLLMGHPYRRATGSPDSHVAAETVALIAHDGMKDAMLTFAAEHFDLLSRFARRVSTASTGVRLNELARSRGWPPNTPWASCCRSGPHGGDAQIAHLVLRHQCQRVLFFRDPLVPHPHEADISVLERAIASRTESAVYIASPAMASRWAEAAERRLRERGDMPPVR